MKIATFLKKIILLVVIGLFLGAVPSAESCDVSVQTNDIFIKESDGYDDHNTSYWDSRTAFNYCKKDASTLSRRAKVPLEAYNCEVQYSGFYTYSYIMKRQRTRDEVIRLKCIRLNKCIAEAKTFANMAYLDEFAQYCQKK